jgi:lipopolysaccharide export system protein LptA
LDQVLAAWVIAGTLAGTPLRAQIPGMPAPATVPGTTAPPQAAQTPSGAMAPPLRFARNVPGDAAPIVLAADQITTWYESEQTVAVLLRGKVYVQQSTVQLRCDQAVARFDLKNRREKGIWMMDLYAEGQVRLDTSADTKEGARAVIDLATRGEIKLHSVKNKAVQQAQSDDPLYRRALAERVQALSPPPTDPAKVQPVSLPVPLPPVVPAPVQPPAVPPTMPTPLPPEPAPVKPLGAAPAPDKVIVRGAPDPDRAGEEVSLRSLLAQAPAPGPPPPPPPNNAPPVTVPPPGPPPSGPGVVPPLTGPPPIGPPSRPAPGPPAAPAPLAPGRTYSVRPRFGADFQFRSQALGNNENAYIITGGVIVNVRGAPNIGQIDIEADRCVIFTHSRTADPIGIRQQNPVGENTKLEFYLAGNVEIREQQKKGGERVLRADEIYYDVDRNVAVALSAVLELRQPPLPDPVLFKADEMLRTSETTYEVKNGDVSSSKLPSDPGLRVYYTTATIEEKKLPKLSFFGQEIVDRATGQPITVTQDYVRARNVFFEVEGVPFLYLPYLAGDARDPLGPIEAINGGYNNIYGAVVGVTLNAYDLIGIQPLTGTRWRLMLDYLSRRGPALGTEFDNGGKDFLGLPSQSYDGVIKAWGIYDQATDNLGGLRPVNFEPPGFRGRALAREAVYDLPHGFTFQSQIAYVSDRNFLEAYYKPEWDTDVNENTYFYAKQQGDFWAWTGYVDQRLGRQWITETESLPRLDGYLLGVTPFRNFDVLDRIVSNTHASLGYYRLITSDDPNFMPLSPTDVTTNTGRADIMQEFSLPFYAGPVKLVPYVQGDVAVYSEDLNGNSLVRGWGGAGLTATIPFTRLFPDVHNDLMNLNGINHKIFLSGNYLLSSATDPHTLVAQLDRLNDNASDQAVRDVREFGYGFLSPGTKHELLTSPLFDPQVYAMRNLLTNNPDSLDTIQVLQLDLYQRWQTKRGYPGAEHIIDWMTLDLSASIFPAPNRDNFGSVVGLLQYDWTWNVGDRTALVSSGLVDPFDDGAKVFTIGAFLNRPDRTNFYLGYRQIEPLQSRLVSASVTYVFSPKYAMTFSTAYDFGPANVQSNSLVLTRIGTDLQVSLGVTYNSLTQSVGAVFEIVPNLAANLHRGGAGSLAALQGSGLGH